MPKLPLVKIPFFVFISERARRVISSLTRSILFVEEKKMTVGSEKNGTQFRGTVLQTIYHTAVARKNKREQPSHYSAQVEEN